MGKRQLTRDELLGQLSSMELPKSQKEIDRESLLNELSALDTTSFSNKTPKKKESTASFGQGSSSDFGYDPYASMSLGALTQVKAFKDAQKKYVEPTLSPEQAKAEADRNAAKAMAFGALNKSTSFINPAGSALVGTRVGSELFAGATDILKFGLGVAGYAESLGRQAINYVADKVGALSESVSEKVYGTKANAPKKENFVNEESFLSDAIRTIGELGDAADMYSKKERGIKDEDLNKGFSDFLSEGRVSDAIGSALYSAIRSAPVTALTMGTGTAAAAAIRGSSLAVPLAFVEISPMAAGTFAASAATGVGAASAQELSEFGQQGDGKITGVEFASILGKGIVEGVTEAFGLTDVNAFNAIRNATTAMGRKEIAETIVKTPMQALRKTLGGANEEGVEEIISSLGEFAIDSIEKGEVDVNQLNNLHKVLIDSYATGAMSGGMLSGAHSSLAFMANRTTASEKKAVEQLTEVINNPSAPQDVKDAAQLSIDNIVNRMSKESIRQYKTVASIESVEDRGRAIKLLSEVDTLAEQRNSNTIVSADEATNMVLGQTPIDMQLGAKLDAQIQEKLDVVNSLIATSNEQKAVRARDAALESFNQYKDTANKFVEESNEYQTFIEEVKPLSGRMDRGEYIDFKDLSAATDVLYNLYDTVNSSEILTKEEKMFAMQRILNEINSFEQYQFATKGGQLIESSNIDSMLPAQKQAKKNSLAKVVQNSRFDGEILSAKDESGRKITYTASLDEVGEVVLTPNKATYQINKETGRREFVPYESISMSQNLELGKVKRDVNGDFVSAQITDLKSGTTFTTNSEQLADYVVASKAKNAIIQSSNAAYEVSDIIEVDNTNNVVNRLTPDQRTRLRNQNKMLKALNPNAKIIVFEDSRAMAKHLMSKGVGRNRAFATAKSSYGLNLGGNEILLNAEYYENLTATSAHEAFHSVVKNLAKNNPKKFQEMVSRIVKYLHSQDVDYLKKFAAMYMKDGVVDMNKVSEEFLAELASIIVDDEQFRFNRPVYNKVMMIIRDFVKALGDALKIDAVSKFANSISFDISKDEDLLNFFDSFKRAARYGEALDTSYLEEIEGQQEITDYTKELEKLFRAEEGDNVAVMQLPADIDTEKVEDFGIKLRIIGQYDFPKGKAPELAKVPVISLAEAIKRNNGRVIVITSDATGYGVDSLGHPILGGYAYSLIEKNVKDGIGYASVSASTAESALTSARNQFGEGKVTVLIMVQNPSTTINNSYGAKYFGRFLKSVAQNHPEHIDELKESIINLFSKNKTIKDSFKQKEKGDVSQKELNDRKKRLYDLIRNADENLDEEKFSEEFIIDTTFNSRKEILQAVIIQSKNISTKSKDTPIYKILSKEYGFTIHDFLKEYGDSSILTDKIIEEDRGGLLVGGFEVEIKSKKEDKERTEDAQSKGIVHPLFNGKLIGENHFSLDGLYDINQNLQKYSILYSRIKDSVDPKTVTKAVLKMFPNENSYKKPDKGKKLELIYSNLKDTNKTKFKNEIAKKKDWLEYYPPNLAVEVARGTGFKVKSQEVLPEMTADEFAKMTIEEEINSVSDGSDFVPEFISQRMLYHGSPHNFDKFELDKVGAGEGVQAYGWGLYFTEDKRIAKSYALSNQGNKLASKGYLNFLPEKIKDEIVRYANTPSATLDGFKKILDKHKGFLGLRIPSSKRRELYSLFGERNLYSAYISENNSPQFADGYWIAWHRPFNLQEANRFTNSVVSAMNWYQKKYPAELIQGIATPKNENEVLAVTGYKMLEALKNAGAFGSMLPNGTKGKGLTQIEGGQLYTWVKNTFRDTYSNYKLPKRDFQMVASKFLNHIGVDGVRVPTFYSSTGVDEGQYNYVVFNDKSVSIRGRETWKQSKVLPDALAADRKEIKRREGLKEKAQSALRAIMINFFERNYDIDNELDRAGLKLSLMLMHNKAGAVENANAKFMSYYNGIFKDMTEQEKNYFDSVVRIKRVLAIDKNFDNRGKVRPQHGKIIKFTKNQDEKTWKEVLLTSESGQEYLDALKADNPEMFAMLEKKAESYFKAYSDILKYKLDNGLIDSKTYEMFKNYDYTPRRFLNHVYGEEITDRYGQVVGFEAKRTGLIKSNGSILSADEIKNIDEGSAGAMLADSAQLLKDYMITTQIRVDTNRFLKQLAKDKAVAEFGFIKEANYERYANGIIKVNKDGSPKFMGASKGFTNMVYRVDGQKRVVQVRADLAKQINDEPLRDIKNSLTATTVGNVVDKIFKVLNFPSRWLRSSATGVNPSFVMSNLPLDALTQVYATNIHEGNIAEQMLSAFGGAVELTNELILMKSGLIENEDLNQLILDYAEDGGLMMSLSQEYSPDFNRKTIKKAVEILSALGNLSELASKLNAYRTVRERLEAEYYNKNKFEPVGQDLMNIRTEAAFTARSAMDYYRGGVYAKLFDSVSPYFNVTMQVAKISFQYAVKNPKEFAVKMFQSSIAMSVLTMYNLMVGGDDYDNEDLQLDLVDGIVIFYPFKNPDGTRSYIKISAPSFVKMPLNVSMRLAEQFYYRNVLKDDAKAAKGMDIWRAQYKRSVGLQNFFGVGNFMPTGLKTAVEVSTNYNFFRGKPIYEGTDVTTGAEGAKDKKVSYTLKKIGQMADEAFGDHHIFSPARMQHVLNSILVPNNPIVASATALADNTTAMIAKSSVKDPSIFKNKYLDGEYDVSASFFKAFTDRVVKKTDPTKKFGSDSYRSMDRAENTETMYRRGAIDAMIESGKPFSQILKYSNDTFGNEFANSTMGYYLVKSNRKKLGYPELLSSDYFPLVYSVNDKARGEKFKEFIENNKGLDKNIVKRDLILLGAFTPEIIKTNYFK